MHPEHRTRPATKRRLLRLEYLEDRAVPAGLPPSPPDTAVAADGSHAVVWSAPPSPFSSDEDVYARVLDAAGNVVKADFRVNTYNAGDQDSPAVAMDADGNFIVVWHSLDQVAPGSAGDVYAQRFDADGNAVGSEFLVNSSTVADQRHPSVAVGTLGASTSSGEFVVVWNTYGVPATPGVYGQRYAAGVATGGEFTIASHNYDDDPGYYQKPVVALNATPTDPADTNEFVVSWARLRGEWVYEDGVRIGAIIEAPEIMARKYNWSGTAQGSEVLVAMATHTFDPGPEVGINAAGGFVVVWSGLDLSVTPSENSVYARRYDAAAAPLAAAFVVAGGAPGFQDATVAVAPTGEFVIAWTELGGADGSGTGIYAQRFNSSGGTVGSTFLVNVVTTGNQQASAVAINASLDFVIAWVDSTTRSRPFDW